MLSIHAHKRKIAIFSIAIATITPAIFLALGKIQVINSSLATSFYSIPEDYTTFVDEVLYSCVANEYLNEFPDDTIPSTGLTDKQLAKITKKGNHLS